MYVILYTIHIYVYAHPPPGPTYFFLFHWLDFIARSIIPYNRYCINTLCVYIYILYIMYIYIYYVYIYIYIMHIYNIYTAKVWWYPLAFPPQDDFLAGRMHSVDDKVGSWAPGRVARGPVWRKAPSENGGFKPKSGICFVFWSWHMVI